MPTNHPNSWVSEIGAPATPATSLSQPSVPASTSAYTNPHAFPCTVYLTGGTVSKVQINGITTGLTSGTFRVAQGGTITLTYSAPPTWVWVDA